MGIVLFLFCENSIGQTFSKRLDNNLSSDYRHVILQPYGYQTIGLGFDSLNGTLALPTQIRGFDFFGNEIYSRFYYSENTFWNPNLDCNIRLNDSTVVFMSIENTNYSDTVYNTVVWVNNWGDTLQTRRYSSPFFELNNPDTYSMVPTCITTDDEGANLYFISQVIESPPIQNNFIVKKISSQGDEIWTQYNSPDNNYYSCSTIRFFNNSVWIIIAGWGQNAYNKLVQINDQNGNWENEIELIPDGQNYYYAEDMRLDNEGAVVACKSLNNSNSKPAIYKMNYEGNYVWNVTPANSEFDYDQDNNHIEESQDGGFVSCSVKYDEIPNPDFPDDPGENNTEQRIWLWKVDENGVFQWQRFYEYFSFDSGYYHLRNVANDFKACPDGGFICAGEATASCIDYPNCDEFTQQGWLLKVDECGCLVPGCDENCVVSVTENSSSESKWFRFGPNPVRDALHIYFPENNTIDISKCQLDVFDLGGKQIKSFQFKHDDTTFIIDCNTLASGEYVFSLRNEDQVLQVERMVVHK
jgi:Secretion system C-terminal sorting domain